MDQNCMPSGCQCDCHRFAGVFHLVACCDQPPFKMAGGLDGTLLSLVKSLDDSSLDLLRKQNLAYWKELVDNVTHVNHVLGIIEDEMLERRS